jgi:hypothetical protein
MVAEPFGAVVAVVVPKVRPVGSASVVVVVVLVVQLEL